MNWSEPQQGEHSMNRGALATLASEFHPFVSEQGVLTEVSRWGGSRIPDSQTGPGGTNG